MGPQGSAFSWGALQGPRSRVLQPWQVHCVPGWELGSSGPRGEALAGGAERRFRPPWSASDAAGL